MLSFSSIEFASDLMLTLAFADGARTALPILLLSVPTVILLAGLAWEKANSIERNPG